MYVCICKCLESFHATTLISMYGNVDYNDDDSNLSRKAIKLGKLSIFTFEHRYVCKTLSFSFDSNKFPNFISFHLLLFLSQTLQKADKK